MIAFVGNIAAEVVKLIASRSMFGTSAKYHKAKILVLYYKGFESDVKLGPNGDFGDIAWNIIIGSALNYYYFTVARRFSNQISKDNSASEQMI